MRVPDVSGPERAGEPVPRVIAVLTTGRQDWGMLRSVCAAIRSTPGLSLALVVGGMHLSPRHGRTLDLLRDEGFEPTASIAWLTDDAGAPEPAGPTQAGLVVDRVGAWLREAQPDALVLAGDRFETAAAALAATIERIPIVHLHGGEQTLGAFDDALRHAISKQAHLHLVSHEEHRRRVIALGEDPAQVHVIGAPGLDNLVRDDLADRAELEAALGLPLGAPVVVVTVQPETLAPDPTAAARAVAGAMDDVQATYVITLPNADPDADEVATILGRAANARTGRVAVAALGERRYWGLLRLADALLGNSSSGIIEAPAIRLPAVNVGDRQAGRRREANVVDVPADRAAVAEALRRVLEPAFRAGIPALDARAADGRAGDRAARIIAGWQPSRPPRKAPISIES